MIIHILPPKRYHLTPSIATKFLELEKGHSFQYVLYCEQEFDIEKYQKLFESINFSNYVFCQSKWELFKYMYKKNKNAVLCHSDDFLYYSIILLLAGCKNISWVCWGAGTTPFRGVKGKVLEIYCRKLYSIVNNIITLMSGDKDSLIKNYQVRSSIIHTIPYGFKSLSPDAAVVYRKLRSQKRNKKKVSVVLGNNPTNIDDYIAMLDRLKHYSGSITIECMLNYSLKKDNRYYDLLEKGSNLFGDDFSTDEVLRNKEDYIQKMNEYDIYICSSKRQTGLGAIYAMLKLGKKVFIAGKNYNWIKNEYNSFIFNADSIGKNLSFSDFSTPLTLDEQEYNLLSNLAKYEENKKKWIDLLNKIDI